MSRCGTVRGYFDHLRAKHPTCQECRAAKREYQAGRTALAGPCSITGCNERSRARGLCARHLDALYRHGDPEYQPPSQSELFWRQVREGAPPECAPALGNCWLWTGNVGTKGYGKFSRRYLLAHRYAWADMVGDVPPGLSLDHLCRIKLCVRPHHLDPVPLRVNTNRQHEARRAA